MNSTVTALWLTLWLWLHCEKGPTEAVLPSPAEEVQPVKGAADTLLLCHHWISPLHINNCLVQLSYQIWQRRVARTAERIIGATLPTLQELYLSKVSKRASKITLDPSHPVQSLFELLPSRRRYRALSTRTTRHRNSLFIQKLTDAPEGKTCIKSQGMKTFEQNEDVYIFLVLPKYHIFFI